MEDGTSLLISRYPDILCIAKPVVPEGRGRVSPGGLVSLLQRRNGPRPGASPHLQLGNMAGDGGGTEGSVQARLVRLVDPSDVPVVRHLEIHIIFNTSHL